MKYIVIKAFNDGLTGFKAVGSSIELDDWRAARLRRMGLIGGRYEKPIRTAVIHEPEIREAVVKPIKKTSVKKATKK
jgi:hypothetical protein